MSHRNLITIHYDGPIAVDHRLSLRTLGVTLSHMQSAIDRAYIELRYGRVVKHARLKQADYAVVDFTVGQPRDGGFIVDLINNTTAGIADRIHSAVSKAYDAASRDAIVVAESINQQAERRASGFKTGAQKAISHSDFATKQESKAEVAKFGDRSITKEIDQVLAQLRVERYEGSTLELILAGRDSHAPLVFDKVKAERFHHVVSARTLGAPIRMEVQIRALDAGRGNSSPSGKATNIESKRDFTIHFSNDDDFNLIARQFRGGSRRPILPIIACPILEYNVFDPEAGDMFFIAAAPT